MTNATHLLAAYSAAVSDQYVDTFLSFYHADARVYDTWSAWSDEGPAARRRVIDAWFSSLGEERVTVRFDDVRVIGDHAMTVLTATGRYAAVSSDGVERRSMHNRLTWAPRFSEGAWLTVHEHTSAPIGGDLKARLTRSDL